MALAALVALAMDTLLMELESINHELRKIGVKDVDKLDPYNAKLPKNFMDHVEFNERAKALEAAESASKEEVTKQQARLELMVDATPPQKRQVEHKLKQERGMMIQLKLATLDHWQNMVSIDASEFHADFARLIDRKIEIYKAMHALKRGGA